MRATADRPAPTRSPISAATSTRWPPACRSWIGAQRQLLHDVSHDCVHHLPCCRRPSGSRADPARFEASLDRIEREAGRLDAGRRGADAVAARGRRERSDQRVRRSCGAGSGDRRRRALEAQAAGRDLHFSRRRRARSSRSARRLLHRAFENVIRNAVRLRRRARWSRSLVLRSTAVLAQCLRPRPGVPEADLQAIFTPFLSQCHGTAATHFGLGSRSRAVRSRATAARSRRNREGGGCQWRYTLPLRRSIRRVPGHRCGAILGRSEEQPWRS